MSIVHREIAKGFWQLSSDTFPLSVEPGPASRNAYLNEKVARARLRFS